LPLAKTRKVETDFWLSQGDRGVVEVTIYESVIGGVLQGRHTGGTIEVLGEKFPRKVGFPPIRMR